MLIEVADTGPGIAPEHLPYVFDRFWRAEKSRNRQTGGSGLGLAIVRQLAKAHGGSAAVRSEPDRGAAFVLRLPRSSLRTFPARRTSKCLIRARRVSAVTKRMCSPMPAAIRSSSVGRVFSMAPVIDARVSSTHLG
ncbi:ATP-binding protein [Microbispora sp. H10949]|uniref:sensor histidine kinase n=1 Tax=Microbispora sp. H10949 TaxID=2729111 RepID=UPI002872E53C|nr:ATP-binding protein [Microbispora sp. H10949]